MGYRHDAAIKFRRKIDAATAMLTDAQAVKVKELYKQWERLIGETIEEEEGVEHKFLYGKDLYKFTGVYPHTFSAAWVPGVGTESLYTRIDEAHAGTLDDPIPYEGNMELVSGMYYIQDGIIYRCTRDTGIPVYSPLSELVGLYVEVVDDSDKSSSGFLTED